MTITPTIQEILTLRQTARAMKERAKLSTIEASECEAKATALEENLSEEERAALNPAAL